jgi:hypothetical protein
VSADDGWMPCSDRSLERQDPLEGSAGFGERWFLVEIDGAWGAHAFLQSRLDPVLGRALVRRIETAGMRPLAIRRTGLRADERRRQSAWRWAVVDARPGSESVSWGSVDDPALLLEVPLDGSTGTPSSDPVICVCTHARHDQCCAVKGRAVVTALARRHPTLTWECSHLGGDRFAATLVVFPHALHYGRVPATQAVHLLDAYADGEVDRRYLRGRSSLPNVAQAAQGFAREALDEPRIDALGLVSSTPGITTQHGGSPQALPGTATDAAPQAADLWTVVLERDGRSVTVVVAQTLSEPLLSTCGALRPGPVRQFALHSIDVG